MKKMSLCLLGLAASVLGACGGSGSNAVFDSQEALLSALESPTGTVSETTALPVAAKIEEMSSSGAGNVFGGGFAGVRDKAQAQSGSGSIDCDGGGSVDIEVNESKAKFKYNSCTMGECTLSGSGVSFIDSAQTCFSMDIGAVCGAESVDVAMSACVNATEGTIEYLVDVEGDTYRVSGSYANGSGQLTITGANGTFTCTYTDGAGSCVDSDGAEFSF